jgi:predicted DCC family thiol-disulfide oxidoreductase YuxK
MKEILQKKHYPSIVFFDGICILCNNSVRLLLKADKKKCLYFSPLQGKYIQSLRLTQDLKSIIFYDNSKIYYKSTAILKLCTRLGGFYRFMGIFYIFPPFVRDFMYDIVAKYRYKVFGKIEVCSLGKEGEFERFIP